MGGVLWLVLDEGRRRRRGGWQIGLADLK